MGNYDLPLNLISSLGHGQDKNCLFLPKLRYPIRQMGRTMQCLQGMEYHCGGSSTEGGKELLEKCFQYFQKNCRPASGQGNKYGKGTAPKHVRPGIQPGIRRR